MVDAVGGAQGDHRFGGDIAEEGEFGADLLVDLDVGAGQDHVGLNAH